MEIGLAHFRSYVLLELDDKMGLESLRGDDLTLFCQLKTNKQKNKEAYWVYIFHRLFVADWAVVIT